MPKTKTVAGVITSATLSYIYSTNLSADQVTALRALGYRRGFVASLHEGQKTQPLCYAGDAAKVSEIETRAALILSGKTVPSNVATTKVTTATVATENGRAQAKANRQAAAARAREARKAKAQGINPAAPAPSAGKITAEQATILLAQGIAPATVVALLQGS